MKKRQISILSFILFLIALLCLPSSSPAEEDTWTRKADMPTAREYLSNNAPVVNGKIYVIGGWLTTNGPGLSAVEEYNPATDTWRKPMRQPQEGLWLLVK